MPLNKWFKQEVESCPRAVNHNIPKEFLHGLAAASVPLFALYCALANPFSSFVKSGRELRSGKVMIHISVTSFSAVIFSSANWKLESGVKAGIFWNKQLCFTRLIVTADVVGQAAVRVLIHSLHSCCTAFCRLVCITCVCVCEFMNKYSGPVVHSGLY